MPDDIDAIFASARPFRGCFRRLPNGPTNVLFQGLDGRGPVTGLKSFDKCDVLGVVIHQVRVLTASAGEVTLQLTDDRGPNRHQAMVACAVEYGAMKRQIGLGHEGVIAALAADLHVIDATLKRGEVAGFERVEDHAQRVRFDCLPNRRDEFGDLVADRRGHGDAAVALGDDHAFFGQLQQRITDRAPAGAEPLGEFDLSQRISLAKTPGGDVVAKLTGNLMTKTANEGRHKLLQIVRQGARISSGGEIF